MTAGPIRPEDFGAAGDGVADDTRAVQAALDRGEGAGVLLAGRAYRISAPLRVGSGTTLQGQGGVIEGVADDQPLVVSRAWADRRSAVGGRTRLIGLRLAGTGRGSRQDGIVLHDFWSEIADCEVGGVGGRGIVLTAENRFGSRIASTLVENRVRRCIVRDSGGTCFFLGEPANGKLTDGELADCIASLRVGAQATAVSIGHAAGWSVRNLHVYGGRPATAVEIRQGYFTRVSGLYVEAFEAVGLALPALQTDVTLADVEIVASEQGEAAVFIAVASHKDYADPRAVLSNVVLTHLGRAGVTALRNEAGAVRVAGAPIVLAGPGAAAIRPGDLPQLLDEKPQAAAPRRVVAWSGGGPRSIELATQPAGGAFAAAMIVTVTGRSTDGALTTRFAGLVQWSAGAAGAPVLADLVPFGDPTGFATPPRATFAKVGDRLALALAFTPVATGAGTLTVG